jgi:hypothetical protein
MGVSALGLPTTYNCGMSKVITGTQLKAAFKKWDVDAEYLPGFETRGRPASLGWGNVHGIIIHHTADETQSESYVNWLFKSGRSDLPAPLCHFATNKKGKTWVGALGRANHAGKGSASVFELVKAEDYDGFNKDLKGGNSKDGNAVFYGNEVMYRGVDGYKMTDAQYKGVVKFCAALCDFHGWSALSIIGHREWSSTKIDPGYIKMYQLRKDVQALLNSKKPDATPAPTPVDTGITLKVQTYYVDRDVLNGYDKPDGKAKKKRERGFKLYTMGHKTVNGTKWVRHPAGLWYRESGLRK